ncbi:MAG: rhodanese-like domain-containing protein [Saprospiraceae bacterium]|nr:rhodanese-like domain-containing protein [Saprospiraceae bacterium]
MVTLFAIVTCAQKKIDPDASAKQASINVLKTTPTDGIILDVRTPEEFKNGHVPQAKNLNFYADNRADLIAELDPSKKYYVYCGGGVRSGKMVAEMNELGITNTVDLHDGFNNWQGDIQLDIQ